ncbi:hypothetical protein [Verrucosispora sp. WMMC514]|uniref:hypothetical protein n=1 Tax=Verrucosispora sp. WMMC514 TaxID=3015156 RepID=UPI00248AB992|nr:hypothetical protein [Verrucosispora sp. WMMC514]WBB94150.1 hypothetical protein O7597_14975 [Verrucosispora sp. WMMC514]
MGAAVAEDGDFVTPTEAKELVHSRPGATAIRRYADIGLLRVTYTAGGHRRIVRASIADLNEVLAMPPGKEKQAAKEALIRKNRGEPTGDQAPET